MSDSDFLIPVISEEINKVYDFTYGLESLRLKFVKILGRENARSGFYGQEINITTHNLCQVNMFLHDVNYEQFDVAHGDTFTDPEHFDDEPLDAVVADLEGVNA